MKSRILYFLILLIPAVMVSCSDDKEVKLKGDGNIAHEGEKWNIVSVGEYALTNVGMSGVESKEGSASGVGSFYFVDNTKGSFEMKIEGYNKEDIFNYTIDDNGGILSTEVSQSVGLKTNQNVVVLSGNKTSETEITFDNISIVKESTSGVFTLVLTDVKLEKVQ